MGVPQGACLAVSQNLRAEPRALLLAPECSGRLRISPPIRADTQRPWTSIPVTRTRRKPSEQGTVLGLRLPRIRDFQSFKGQNVTCGPSNWVLGSVSRRTACGTQSGWLGACWHHECTGRQSPQIHMPPLSPQGLTLEPVGWDPHNPTPQK